MWACVCISVCALFICTATLCVCVCVCFLSFTEHNYSCPYTNTMSCSDCFFPFAKLLSRLTVLSFLTCSKAPSVAPAGPISLHSDQLLELLHPVKGRASLEPLNLRLIEGVVERDGFLAAIAVLDHCCQGLGGIGGKIRLCVNHLSLSLCSDNLFCPLDKYLTSTE